MKDEIKEILEDVKRHLDYVEATKQASIRDNEMKAMYDYITNLQEELKEYKMIFDTFSKRPYAHRYLEEKKKELGNNKIIGLDSEMIYKDYYDLKEENERLKEIEKEHKNCTRKHWQQKCAEHCANEMIYKSRNEKAIEYINNDLLISVLPNNQIINGNEVVKRINYIEKLLNGDDK
jgi:hypothetical protein